jgi:predicted nucleotidyltransferase
MPAKRNIEINDAYRQNNAGSLGLFGSFSKGEQIKESDLDKREKPYWHVK